MISVLLPTLHRPQMAAAAVQSLYETIGEHAVELVVAVDDEPADGPTEQAIEAVLLPDASVVWSRSGSPQGCSAAWNRALRRSTGDPVVFAADDLCFQQGWLDAALAELARFEDGWGLVGFNDGHWGAELSTHYLLSRRFIIEVLGGVIAWEGYKHSFNDLETCERAKAAGRYAWCGDARVYHAHWLFGDREKDETDLRRLPEHPADEQLFRERQAAGFPNAGITPVIG